MPKPHAQFVCQHCGATAPKWTGRCESCGEWNTIIEETAPSVSLGRGGVRDLVLNRLSDRTEAVQRWPIGISEFDRVLGGGLVPGSIILITGEPGIGKSTLLLQAGHALTQRQKQVVYISGEEAEDQIRLRAIRLGVEQAPIQLAANTDAAAVAKHILRASADTVLIIDSIQTLQMPSLDAAPGSPSQIKASAMEIIHAAKSKSIPVILVGHVIKDGSIAGPRVLEHMVDAVLSFEGDAALSHRILRTSKNRFGATDEVGVFEMRETGLAEVPNPSSLFLSAVRAGTPGCAVFPTMEGTRPLLVEVQALVSPMGYGSPRRSVVGWDNARMAMILAVLHSRCNITLADQDVYLNVVGGMRINEPAADLAVAAAITSARLGIALPETAIFFGEVGLSGEIRHVGQPGNRLREALKLGFDQAYCPGPCLGAPEGIAVHPSQRLRSFVATIQELAPPR